VDEARLRQKIRGKDEAEAEMSRQGEADILRGKDEAALVLPRGASRQGICLEDYITGILPIISFAELAYTHGDVRIGCN